MGLLHKIGAIKSFQKNGVAGLLGVDQIDQELIKNVPADMAGLPHFQIKGINYGIGSGVSVIGECNDAANFIDGARVVIATPFDFRILAHISNVKINGNKIKFKLIGLDQAVVRRLGWVAVVNNSIAEYNNIPDGMAFGDRSQPIMLAAGAARVKIGPFTGYRFDGWMCCGDFAEGDEITIFRALSRIDAKVHSVKVYDKEKDGVMQHRATIGVQLLFGELSGDLTGNSSTTEITIVRKDPSEVAKTA